MQSLSVQSLVERFENDPGHGFSLTDWAAILWQVSDEHASKPAPFPVRFTSHQHRLQVYEARALAGCDLFHVDDIPPPLETPDDEWNDGDRPDAAHEEGRGTQPGQTGQILAA